MEQNELDSTCGVSDDELTKRFIEAIRIENEIDGVSHLWKSFQKQPTLRDDLKMCC